MREGPIRLPPAAYGGPVRRCDEPIPVRVWIPRARFGWTQFDGEADEWTDVAVHVTYRDEHYRTGRAWVWAGAVTRR
ncbi:hypothetical protein GCM10025875_37370 [Litorihabitans aurantiacus]|uniref:Uncharacterized protein n=1 Tax=Litorihabitans aurantiacus TaxID=1930061 RepID=A0AA38CWW3_9MICO|nr:hypothetical protein GCM10025875_36680 [Litorihabitans aurantiacus]GMA33745.1 hypothetical protein GCM10025875_37370 [Litorihabitans aurantiacus]